MAKYKVLMKGIIKSISNNVKKIVIGLIKIKN